MQRWVSVGVLVAMLALAGCSSDDPPPLAPASKAPAAAGGTSGTTAVSDPYRSTVAEALVPSVKVYDHEGATTPVRTIAQPNDPPRPLVFLVQKEHPPLWLEVLLPVRPNGSTGWIKATDVRLTEHDYRITIQLNAHRIIVTRGPTTLVNAPIGVGRAQTPTPGGRYYTKELLRPPRPDGVYGPYAYGLSGFSNELTTFDGGEGVIGIHGTNDPSGLGKDVSHGCIRISNDAIDLLAKTLPLGVPVEIVA
jgi:lipoprotein-anchoring transpeptidase ErfK/SrfK